MVSAGQYRHGSTAGRWDEIQFHNEIYQKIFDSYTQKMTAEEALPDEKFFINHASRDLANQAIDLLTSPYELSPKWESVARIEVTTEAEKLKIAVVNAVLSFKAKKVEQLISENQEEIKLAQQEENFEDIPILLKKQQELKAISKSINSQLGRVITR